jgi:hypothetical protein
VKEASDLRTRAEEMLTRVKKAGGPPIFVEFAGTPKSGKSTCIEGVRHFFRRIGYRVLAPTEGASKRTPYFLRGDLVAFNAWSACYAVSSILEARYHSDKYDVALLDRGIFDAFAWFEYLRKSGLLNEAEQSAINGFLTIDKWKAQIGLVVLLVANAKTSMDRENADKLIFEEGRAMNREVLEGLNKAYEAVKDHHSTIFPKLIDIDTSEGGPSLWDVSYKVTSTILDLLEERLA